MGSVTDTKEQFNIRLDIGLKFEDRVERILGQRGFLVCKFGMDTLPKFIKEKLIYLNDSTSKFLRFLPDRLCISESETFFVECKYQISKTPNYSFNLEEYEGQLELAEAGIRILVVFSGFKAQWIEKLPVTRVFTDTDLLSIFGGSKRPFVLIPKQGLPNLSEIIETRESFKKEWSEN